MGLGASQWRSMWRQTSRRSSRRRTLPVLFVVAGVALCGLGVLYGTGSWFFKKKVAPVELSATTGLPAWTEAPQSLPAAAVEPEADPPPVQERAETAPSPAAIGMAQAADTELRALRGSEADVLRRRVGTLVIDERYPREAREAWLVEARELSQRVVFSASPMKSATTVAVGRGDTLLEICAKLRRDQKVSVTPRFLELVNDVSAARLRSGTTLKVPTEPMSVLVDKDEFRLYVLLGGCFLKDYPVGTGRNQRTPEGRFTIQSKTKNPQWTDPETGKTFRFGEPGHVIGTRWMGFAGEHGKTGFGIHGTTDPSSIGRAESAGCIRMNRDEVEELYDLVPQGAEVVIRR